MIVTFITTLILYILLILACELILPLNSMNGVNNKRKVIVSRFLFDINLIKYILILRFVRITQYD